MGLENRPAAAAGLSEREQLILRSVVESFVETGEPVGSRALARRFGIGLSAASIRNTMSDLEELGFLGHPYTSAGRVPTEIGYRLYVDDLIGAPALSEADRATILAEIVRISRESQELWRESSRLLGRLSNLLGVVLTPKLSLGVFSRLDIVPVSSTSSLFVISVQSGLVKTIVLEVPLELRPEKRLELVSILNERLSGLTLEQIRNTFEDRVRDLQPDPTGLIGVVLKHASVLFDEIPQSRRVSVSGTHHIVNQPEFHDADAMRNVMELMEDEEVVVRLLEKPLESTDRPTVAVKIGGENGEQKAKQYSVVCSGYVLGGTSGTIGIIGPTRMEYGRMIAIVEEMAAFMARPPEDWPGGVL